LLWAHPAARALLLSAVVILPLSAVLAGEDEEDYGGLPPGAGRETTFDACNACHSAMLVAQQRLARDIWDETLDWMVEEQGMDALEPEERKQILDYLSTHLSRDTPR
jgi:cytochrome c